MERTNIIPHGYAKRTWDYLDTVIVADHEVETAVGGAATALAVDRPEATALALALLYELTQDVEAWVLVVQMMTISEKAGLWAPEFNDLLREHWKATVA